MDPINKLVELFSEFPGIGPRQAKRFVYYLLRHSNGFVGELSKNILELKKTITSCSICFQYFQKKSASEHLCSICSGEHRDETQLMIVSHDVDLEHIEKSGVYKGRYFVLGGIVPILTPKGQERIRSRELVSLVKKQAEKDDTNSLKEIILAMNITPEGENTEQYLIQTLTPITTQYSIKISHLGRGISTGTEIEYSDKETLKNALQNRK
jgi:recombination protein RecR